MIQEADSGLLKSRTTHASRTLMTKDLTILLETLPSGSSEDYRNAIVEENILLRKSVSARTKTREHLAALYSLDERDAVFRAMRLSFVSDPESLPLVALLCGITRDSLLRATAERVLATPFGAGISPGDMSEAVAELFPQRFSSSNLKEIGRRTLSSWAQAGHVSGRATKRVRDRARPSAGSAAFALYLGYLSGVRGLGLLDTFWTRMLEAPEGELDALAFAASQRGLMEYRRMGDVAEFGFSAFERGG